MRRARLKEVPNNCKIRVQSERYSETTQIPRNESVSPEETDCRGRG
jgi:hypothetical protein